MRERGRGGEGGGIGREGTRDRRFVDLSVAIFRGRRQNTENFTCIQIYIATATTLVCEEADAEVDGNTIASRKSRPFALSYKAYFG